MEKLGDVLYEKLSIKVRESEEVVFMDGEASEMLINNKHIC
jgi:hypothetical protein